MRSKVARLIRLTSNLLYLAHAEAGREVAQMPVELDRLCEDVLREMDGVRFGVALRFDHRERVTVRGDSGGTRPDWHHITSGPATAVAHA